MKRRLLALVISGPLLFAACGGGEDPTVESPESTGRAQGQRGVPNVAITAPENGSTVKPGAVEVTVATERFDIVDKLNDDPAAGEGHVHYYLDVDEIPTTPGKPAVTEKGTYHAAATTSHTWKGIEAGEHTFAVQLVNNDHTPLEPPITAETTVTVAPDR